MDVQIKKWGNSIGFRIPYKLAEQLGLSENSIVEVTAKDDVLTIKPKPEPQAVTLDALLDSIPDDFEYPQDVADFVDSESVGQELL